MAVLCLVAVYHSAGICTGTGLGYKYMYLAIREILQIQKLLCEFAELQIARNICTLKLPTSNLGGKTISEASLMTYHLGYKFFCPILGEKKKECRFSLNSFR